MKTGVYIIANLENGNPDAIGSAIKGRLKTSSGFVWRYASKVEEE